MPFPAIPAPSVLLPPLPCPLLGDQDDVGIAVYCCLHLQQTPAALKHVISQDEDEVAARGGDTAQLIELLPAMGKIKGGKNSRYGNKMVAALIWTAAGELQDQPLATPSSPSLIEAHRCPLTGIQSPGRSRRLSALAGYTGPGQSPAAQVRSS